MASVDRSKPIRVLVVSPYYYPVWGGAENQAKLLFAELGSRGLIQLTVLTLHLFGGSGEEMVGDQRVLRFGRSDGTVCPRTGLLKILEWLEANAGAYDLVHHIFIFGQYPEIQLQVGRLCAVLGIPTVLKITSSRKVSALCSDISAGAQLLRNYGRIIALNGEIAAELQAVGVDRHRVLCIPNGVDTTVFKPPSPRQRRAARAVAGYGDDDFVVVYVGRLVAKKNVRLLLAACAGARRDGARLRVLIVGDDERDRQKHQPDNIPNELSLRALGRHLGLDCAWAGAVSQAALVRAKFWCGDCFVLPSVNEGCSNALLEAMSCGLPCIVSRISANTEVINNPSCTFDPEDCGGLTECLLQMASDNERRAVTGAAARARVASSFSIDEVASRYYRAYSELMSARVVEGAPPYG